jgi:hypothetical protein
MCRTRFPDSEWIVSDMRQLALGRRFDAVLAWDSFFHLHMDDQRAMSYCDEPLYHASLDRAEYEAFLKTNGFSVSAYTPDDPHCAGHTVWLAIRR